MFELVELKHIYHEINTRVDILAKDGASVMDGFWHIKEFRASETYETYQIF